MVTFIVVCILTFSDNAIQPLVDYFKSRYSTSANFAINVGCLPYQSKQFVKPACLVHQHPVTNEIESETTINGNTETKAQREFWMIFKRTSHKIPNTILIEGTSGMGKTILAKEIACQWAQGLLLTNIATTFVAGIP